MFGNIARAKSSWGMLVDHVEQITAEILSLYQHQLAFWDRLNLSDADLRFYDLTSKRIEELRRELEGIIAASGTTDSAA